jgi:hypothetical protein
MTWDSERSKLRIQNHLGTAPSIEDGVTLAKDAAMRAEARRAGALEALSARRAFVVDGVHLYGHLLDFDNLVSERGVETEASHRRLLSFPNMHYRVWDSIVDQDGDRVDYHGARLHAIVTEPSANPAAQLERATALAAKLTEVGRRLGRQYSFPSRIRFGLDHGKCLAMTTGRQHEKDTLFLGVPANYAAKLAAAGTQEGIFLTPSAEALVDQAAVRKVADGSSRAAEEFVVTASQRNAFPTIDAAANRLLTEGLDDPAFRFHRQMPPLSQVKFSELSPSNSVRMGMASLFADIDGFTNFVDTAIRAGSKTIKPAATLIHVVREELNDVLTKDFGGKRIRFIGDCIHGCIAAGEREDDACGAVLEAAMCMSAMRSSFSLCLEALPIKCLNRLGCGR